MIKLSGVIRKAIKSSLLIWNEIGDYNHLDILFYGFSLLQEGK